jgi:multicomponent K+:H+ antiporter subunit F/multicomponent Na+:H+ antiporter subunit F
MVVDIALACIMLSQVFGVYRIVRGPTWGDRVAALDFLGVCLAVLIVLLALRTGFTAFLDAALIVSILGFLSTVALTRYRLSRRLMK